MPTICKKIISNASGATAIEYAIIAFFIGIVAVVAIKSVGTNLKKPYEHVAENLK